MDKYEQVKQQLEEEQQRSESTEEGEGDTQLGDLRTPRSRLGFV